MSSFARSIILGLGGRGNLASGNYLFHWSLGGLHYDAPNSPPAVFKAVFNIADIDVLGHVHSLPEATLLLHSVRLAEQPRNVLVHGQW